MFGLGEQVAISVVFPVERLILSELTEERILGEGRCRWFFNALELAEQIALEGSYRLELFLLASVLLILVHYYYN